MLDLISKKLGKNVSKSIVARDELKKIALDSFLCLCRDAQHALEVGGLSHQFQRLFPDYRNFVIHVPVAMLSDSGKNAFSSTNQKNTKNLIKRLLSWKAY